MSWETMENRVDRIWNKLGVIGRTLGGIIGLAVLVIIVGAVLYGIIIVQTKNDTPTVAEQTTMTQTTSVTQTTQAPIVYNCAYSAEEIETVQAMMKLAGAYDATVNGVYDSIMSDAIRQLQTSCKVQSTGELDEETIALVKQQLCKVLRETGSVGKPTRVLEEGMSGDDVLYLQMAMAVLNYDVPISGTYDEVTTKKVKIRQKQRKCTESGKADESFVNSLDASILSYVETKKKDVVIW